MGIERIVQDWDALKVLRALVQSGTIQKAAKLLNVNPTTVSRKIEKLTKDIGDTLVLRKNGIWVPTELGKWLSELADRINEEVANELLLRQESKSKSRNIVISSNRLLQGQYVERIMQGTENSLGTISVTLTSETKSLALGEVDIHIGHEKPVHGRLVRVYLGTSNFGIFDPADRPTCGWVRYSNHKFDALAAEMEEHFQMPPRFSTDCMQSAKDVAMTHGFSCVLSTTNPKSYHGMLRSKEMKGHVELPVWMSYHETLRHDQALKSLRESLVSQSNVIETNAGRRESKK